MTITQVPISTLKNVANGIAGLDSSAAFAGKIANRVSVKDFGAVGDGVTDDYQAFRDALDSFGADSRGGRVIVPFGRYKLSQTLVIDNKCSLIGDGQGEQVTYAGTELIFPANTTGLRFVSSLEGGTSASKSHVSDIAIYCSSKQSSGHGIHASTMVYLNRVNVDNFAGNGVHIAATSQDNTGNANLWAIQDSQIKNCSGHGLYVQGADANAGYALNLDCSSNGGWGIYDASFLGNTYLACHISNNGIGAAKTIGAVSASMFIGCYIEAAGNYGVEIVPPSMAFGGIMGVGRDYPFVEITGDGTGAEAYAITNGSMVTGIQVVSFGSGYTTASVSITGGSGSGATASAVITDGKLTAINVTSGGSNYPSNGTKRIKIKDDGAPGGFVTGRIRSLMASGSEYPSEVILNGAEDTSLRFSADGANHTDIRWNKATGCFEVCSNKSTATTSMRFVTNLSTTEKGGRSASLPDGSIEFPKGYWIGDGANARYVGIGTAAPTSGEYKRGDRVENINPSSAGYAGWICTVSGTPGTWNAYGLIS